MAWVDVEERIADANISAFGETVTLPTGDATGVFQLRPDQPQGGFGSDVGRTFRASQQISPKLWMKDADIVSLAELDAVVVRGVDYEVTRIDPDGFGMTEISLMPTTSSGGDELGRYR